MKKEDLVDEIEVRYTYDIDNPSAYGNDNPGAPGPMYYETYDVSVQPEDLLSTTWYYYNESGNPTRIVTEQDGSTHYACTRFGYAGNEQAVTFIIGEEWDWDGDPEHDPTNYQVTYAREFRYDSGRARYLARELDPEDLMEDTYTVISDTWSDYAASPGGAGDCDSIYGDYTISGSAFVNARSFEPGMATVDPWTDEGGDNTEYFHTNHLGTTRFMSDPDGDPVDAAVYTAFGERVDGTNHRYGYAGAHGYQAHNFPESPAAGMSLGGLHFEGASVTAA